MVIALPNEIDGLGDVAHRLDAGELTQMLAALRKESPRLVSLMLPRFKAEYAASLKDVFQKLGMTLPFDGSRSDFSGLTGVPPKSAPTYIDQIVHKAVIEVSEESTEAAAATAIGVQHHQRRAEAGRAAAVPRRPAISLLPGRRRDRRGAVPGPRCRSAVRLPRLHAYTREASGRVSTQGKLRSGRSSGCYAELAWRHRRVLAQDHMRVVAVRTPDGELEGRQPTQLFVRRLDAGAHRLAALGTPINQHNATPPTRVD